MINQSLYMVALFVVGLLIVSRLKEVLGLKKTYLLAFPVGVATCGSMTSVLTFTVGLSLSKLVLFLLVSFFIVNGKMFLHYLKQMISIESIGAVIFIFLTSAVVQEINFTIYHNDALLTEGVGRMLAKSGSVDFSLESSQLWVSAHLIFLPCLHAIGKLLHIEYLFTLYPLLSINLILLFLNVSFEKITYIPLNNNLKVKIVGVFALLLFSSPAYFKNTFYVFTNLLVALFLLIVMDLIVKAREKKNTNLMMLAGFLMSCTALARAEMTVVAYLVLAVVVSFPSIEEKKIISFLLAYVPLPLLWHGATLEMMGLSEHSHGNAGIQIILILGTFLTVAVHRIFKNIDIRLRQTIPSFIFVVLFLILGTFVLAGGYESIHLFEVMGDVFLGQRRWWGGFWLAWFVAMVALFPVTSRILKNPYGMITVTYLLSVMSLHIIFRERFTAFQDGFGRILLNIAPCAAVYMIYAFTQQVAKSQAKTC